MARRDDLGTQSVRNKREPDGNSQLDRDDPAAPQGRWQQLAIALGGVLGSGWLIAIPQTNGWMGTVQWLLGLAGVGLVAAMVVQLAKADPRPGGLAWWPTYTSGLVAGTVVNAGLFMVYAGNPSSGSATAVMELSRLSGMNLCKDPLVRTCDQLNSVLSWRGWLLATVIMTALFAVHAIGMRLMLRMNIAFSAVKTAILLLLPVTAVLSQVRPFPPAPPPHPDPVIATVAGGILFAYTGFQGPVDHGAKQGRESRGFAIGGALIIAAIIYLGLQLTTTLPWHSPALPLDNVTHVLLETASLLAPLTNALLFVSLAGIVLRESVEQRVLALPKPGWRVEWRVYPVAYLFSVGYSLLAVIDLNSISNSKNVIYLFVYSYAAVSYSALQKTGKFKNLGRLGKPLRALAPLSFVVATVLAYYADTSQLALGYALMLLVGIGMFLTKLRQSRGRNWAEHWRRGRNVLSYLLTLLALSGTNSLIHLLPPLREGQPGSTNPSSLITHALAVAAAAAGFFFYRKLVQESVRYLNFTDRTLA